AQSASGLPPAQEVIARYVKAVGGDAWKSHKSARMKATMSVPAAGISSTMEVVQVFPNTIMEKTTIAGMGEMKTGFDGTVAWSIDPMQGPRVLSGPEEASMRESANPANALRMSEDIASSETVEKTTSSDQECYKVKHTWKSGRVSHDCYSVKDGLLISTTTKQASPMGEVEVTQVHKDYKDFGGMKRPTVVTSQMMGQEITVTLTSWEWDTVDPKELELPAEIRALVGKKP
ncbi:MAG TPA: hypothetical protein VLE53_14975, partial [Gemmatimonadaceae bacterium]|nr:hypothetical protein [Gemmatimonadaceae bacterium]